MSRIGKSPISIPSGVDIDYNKEKSIVTIKGTKGTLVQPIDKDIELKIEDGTLTLARPTEQKRHKALHGLYRSLINNMIEGVSNGYKKKLELVGVGYRATVSGQILEMALGFSHPVVMQIPNEIKVSADMPKGVPPFIILESFDKQLLGQVCARIRKVRPIEPYKGKGIRFENEVIRRKAGKTAAS